MRKLTTKEIKERIYSLEGDNYELLSEYVNSQTKMKVKHVVCGHQYEATWNDFQQGRRCPKCGGTMKLTNEDVVQKMYELVGSEYTKLDDTYINNQTKFLIRHNLCNHEYEVNWANFSMGKRCPKCGGSMKLTTEDIKERIYSLEKDNYELLSDYVNAKTKIKVKHNVCEHVFETTWDNFLQGSRCPFCNQSKGERFIQNYLTNQGISFATEVRFSDCRYKRPLPFDFAILDDNKRVFCLVEYDGEQHFIPVEPWGGEQTLKEVQLRDQIKDDYCKKNNIPLLRIRYDDEDIEEKLNLFLYGLKAEKEV